MFRTLRHMPLFKLLAVGQTVLLAWRHLQHLDANDRRRLRELVRRGRQINKAERAELRGILGKLEPAAFAFDSARRFSPVPIPGKYGAKRKTDRPRHDATRGRAGYPAAALCSPRSWSPIEAKSRSA